MKQKRIWIGLVGLVFFLLSVCSYVFAAETLIQENWSLVEKNNKPVGYGYEKTWKTDEGFRCISEMIIEEQTGGKPSRNHFYNEMVVDKDYLAQSMVSVTDLDGFQVYTKADFEPGQVIVFTDTPNNPDKMRIIPLEQPVYFKDSFIKYVIANKKLHVGASYTGAIWDDENSNMKDYTIMVNESRNQEYEGKKVPVYLLSENNPQGRQFLMDAKGISYWARIDGGLKFVKTAQAKIDEQKSGFMCNFIIPGNRKVSTPLSSTTSQILLTWNKTPVSDFKLEDNRQKLQSNLKAGAYREIILDIQKDLNDYSGKVQLPVTDQTLAPFLADLEPITPALPEIKKLAREIIKTEADGWAATKKLILWVHDNIRPDHFAKMQSMEQILKVKKANCADFAVLFATLGRSVGLPTRLAFGKRYVNNFWVNQIWNEVWIGQWIAVDTFNQQVAPDALLVKLTDGNSVNMITKLGLQLTGNLKMMIRELSVPELSPVQNKTGRINGRMYTNPDFNCQITVPQGWMMNEGTRQGTLVLMMNAPSLQTRGFLLMSSVSEGTTPEQIMESRIPSLVKVLPEFTPVNLGNSTIHMIPAVVGTWTFDHQEKRYTQQNWVFVSGKLSYLFIFEAPEHEWKLHEGEFAKIRGEFKLLNDRI